jgi:hypothetical protein
MRMVLSLVCALALVSFVRADDKKEITVKGDVCCAKCEMKKQDTCNAVILVRAGDKEEIYYFDADSQEKHGQECCKEKKPATITGTVTEKDGKKWIAVTKIEYQKKD